MSGASGSFGVTRYQWPRIIAAKTPPIAAVTTASWVRSDTVPIGPPPQARAPKTSVAAPAATAAHSTTVPAVGRMRRATRPITASAQNATRAEWRGPSHAASRTTGEAPRVAGSAPSRQPGEDPEADRAGRGEAEVARRRRRAPAEQDHRRVRPEREPGQHGPVDEGEVRGDLGGGHDPSVAAAGVAGLAAHRRPLYHRAGGITDDIRPRHDIHLVRPCLLRGPDAGRQGRADRPVVRQSASSTKAADRSSRAT